MKKILIITSIGLLAYHYKHLFNSLPAAAEMPNNPVIPIINQTPIIATLPNGQTVITIPKDYIPETGSYYQPTVANYDQSIGNYVGEQMVISNPNQFYLDFLANNNNVIFTDSDGFSVLIKNNTVKIASGKELNIYGINLVEFKIWDYFIKNLPQYAIY
jgi:hypothetical protein